MYTSNKEDIIHQYKPDKDEFIRQSNSFLTPDRDNTFHLGINHFDNGTSSLNYPTNRKKPIRKSRFLFPK